MNTLGVLPQGPSLSVSDRLAFIQAGCTLQLLTDYKFPFEEEKLIYFSFTNATSLYDPLSFHSMTNSPEYIIAPKQALYTGSLRCFIGGITDTGQAGSVFIANNALGSIASFNFYADQILRPEVNLNASVYAATDSQFMVGLSSEINPNLFINAYSCIFTLKC